MDLTKLSGGSWGADMGSLAGMGSQAALERESTVETFMRDTAPAKIAQSVGDLLQLTRERQARQFIGQSSSTPNLTARTSARDKAGGSAQSKRPVGGGGSSRKALPGVSYTIQERPPNRSDIEALDRELESRVQAIVNLDQDAVHSRLSMSDLYDPHKDTVTIIRNKLLAEFRADQETLQQEPWLDRLIRCECIKITCDDIGLKLVDMVAVSSTELGHVLRKLRLSYRQSFDQMRHSWQMLRSAYLSDEDELVGNREELSRVIDELNTKEQSMRMGMDSEIDRITAEFSEERAKDRAALAASEYKMEQMAETLQSLNGIFKSMQTDGTVTRAADMTSKCQRLERENSDLSSKCLALDKVKNDLAVATERIEQLEKEARVREMELVTLKQQMVRREETVVALMEKESLRMAEIEKLKSIAGMQDDGEDFATDFKEPATSVLCIKCKKSLDDISNIRAAVLGKGDGKPFACESFRILLPNLRGRRPDRAVKWVRNCMRCILVAKMREDVALLSIKGEVTRFPLFVYSWFERTAADFTKQALLAAQFQSDEDRWGFYYGVKAMVREGDAEAVIFWSLLDESQGEDGMQFAFHCMSMAMSMGGAELWAQFGPVLTAKSANVNVKPTDDDAARVNIWLDLGSAIEALKAILVRALKPHVQEAVDAIYALKVVPSIVDPQVKEEIEAAATAAAAKGAVEAWPEEDGDFLEGEEEGEGEGGVEGEDGAEGGGGEFEDPAAADDESGALQAPRRRKRRQQEQQEVAPKSADASSQDPAAHQEPTHISFFVWMRLMMQQIQAEQIHRAAAVRLMFESASVGALTPQLATASDPLEPGTSGSQLEYPQFQAICRTLFPSISVLDAASLYAQCFDEGRRKVTADVLLKVGDRLGLFSRAMRLGTLPLLAHVLSSESLQDALAAGGGFAGLTTGSASRASRSRPTSATVSSADVTVLRTGPVTKEDLLRYRLGALIHRKLAAITPDLLLLAKRMPERWRAMLLEARDQCVWALNDAYEKIKRSKLAGSRDDDGLKAKSRHFIDGIQPYIYYRRLLSVVLMVKSLSDNPLMPAELFMGGSSSSGKSVLLPSMDLGLKQTENLLSSLEEGIVTAVRLDTSARDENGLVMGASTTSNEAKLFKIADNLGKSLFGERGVSKVFRFEAARRSLVARRLQTLFRQFLHNPDTVVPLALRKCMRPGYLRGARELKTRNVVFEPWWGQSLVADIYAFKLTFDGKASRLGLPPLPLGDAAAAAVYARWGSFDLAERDLHDLCNCVRSYSPSSPRLRLFSALVGQPCELEAGVAAALCSPQAAGVYLNLVVEVHLEISRDAAGLAGTGSGAGDFALPHIEVLFPSAGNPTTRTDKRDCWQADGVLVVNAVTRWAAVQRGLDEESLAAFTDLAEYVRGSSTFTDGTVDVDDVLWVIMAQWARFTQWFTKRAAARAAWNQTNAPQIKVKVFSAQLETLRIKTPALSRPSTTSKRPSRPTTAANVLAADADAAAAAAAAANAKTKPPLPASLHGTYLRSLVESLYRAGEGASTTDAAHYAWRYQQACARLTTKAGYTLDVMDDLLRGCALWDTNTAAASQGNNVSTHHVGAILCGTSGANAVAAAALSLAAYKDSIKETLAGFSEMMKEMHSPELERSILSAENALQQLTVDMAATAAQVRSLMPDQQRRAADERWTQFSSLASALEDLLMSFNVLGTQSLAFPKDRQTPSRTVALPGAGCYNIPLKNVTT